MQKITMAIVVLATISTTAFAGALRGSVRLAPTPDGSDPETPPYYWRVWNGFVEVAAPVAHPERELNIILVGGNVPEPLGCDYRLRGGDLSPRTMAVRPGGVLRIENRDPFEHELQATAIPEFAALPTTPGNPRAVPIPSGGPYAISDRVYSHVHGFVHVVDGLAACAAVNSDGTFTFPTVPDGAYTLKVLRGDREVHSASVTVSAAAEPLAPIVVP